MPGPILHMGAVVMCSHGGSAMATQPFPRVTVSGQPVLQLPALHSIAGCPFNVSGSPVPCVTATFVVGSVRVLAGGIPVALSTGQSLTVPNATPLNVLVVQPRVKAT